MQNDRISPKHHLKEVVQAGYHMLLIPSGYTLVLG